MEFGDAVSRRRMVRSYTSEPIDPGIVDRIVDAGIRAPSAGFAQGQRFIIIRDSDMRSRIAACAGEPSYVDRGFEPWLSTAPIHVVLGTDVSAYEHRYAQPDKRSSRAKDEGGAWVVPWWWVDAGASLMAILLAAVDEGVGAGFLGAHAFAGLGELLDLPEDVTPVGVVTLGHPTLGHPTLGRSADLGRLPRDRSVRYERWTSA